MSETISEAGQRARRRIAMRLLPPKEIAAPEPALAEKS